MNNDCPTPAAANVENRLLRSLKPLIFISFVLLSTMALGQTPCPKCDIQTIRDVRSEGRKPTIELVLGFLCSIDKSCSDNAEFSEASNATIFHLLDINAERFIVSLDYEDVDVQLILATVENPIHDGIDLQLCCDHVAKLDKSKKYRAEVLEALTRAARKSNMELKK